MLSRGHYIVRGHYFIRGLLRVAKVGPSWGGPPGSCERLLHFYPANLAVCRSGVVLGPQLWSQ